MKSQIVMYVNNKPPLHINQRDLFIYLLNLFIALNNLIICYIPFIAMYKQLNIVHIYNIICYVWCSWGCGVCVGRGRLGVCGSAVVPPLWRLGGFGAVMFGNTADRQSDRQTDRHTDTQSQKSIGATRVIQG